MGGRGAGLAAQRVVGQFGASGVEQGIAPRRCQRGARTRYKAEKYQFFLGKMIKGLYNRIEELEDEQKKDLEDEQSNDVWNHVVENLQINPNISEENT